MPWACPSTVMTPALASGKTASAAAERPKSEVSSTASGSTGLR